MLFYAHTIWVYSLIGKTTVSKTVVRGSSPRGPALRSNADINHLPPAVYVYIKIAPFSI